MGMNTNQRKILQHHIKLSSADLKLPQNKLALTNLKILTETMNLNVFNRNKISKAKHNQLKRVNESYEQVKDQNAKLFNLHKEK